MPINPEIRDQAYQFFIQEAPELLQELESGLLRLSQQRSTAQVHDLMRAAHSIKGGAASVGLDAIATVAHRLENVFKALYSESLEIDTALENQLLQAYDCLRLPLAEQIAAGQFDAEQALTTAELVFSQIEDQLGDALARSENYVPTSADLGVDMVASILEVDVAEGLARLADVITSPHLYEVAGELRAQVEVFAGFAELFKLQELGDIATAVQQALDCQPHRALEIAQLAIADFERSRQAILAGNPAVSGPSEALLALVEWPEDALNSVQITDSQFTNEEAALTASHSTTPRLEDIFGAIAMPDLEEDDAAIAAEMEEFSEIDVEIWNQEIAAIADQNSKAASMSVPPAIEGSGVPVSMDIGSFAAAPLQVPSALTIRVDSERLQRMNNLVGELSINRDGLSLQNDQLQGKLQELLTRFGRFRGIVNQVRELSDQMLVTSERHASNTAVSRPSNGDRQASFTPGNWALDRTALNSTLAEFDSLEMDRYSVLHTQLQEILEDLVQLEESVDDIALFARQSDQRLGEQQHMLGQLRDELNWARMLPLSEVLNRFPRILRDLSRTYHKPVQLKMTGTGVLVDKAILEKLYDPLLHLLRNAFDHGIEAPDIRQQQGKPEQGLIEIRAYHKGNQTIVEVRDDGQGLDLDRIRHRAYELGWFTADQLVGIPPHELLELLFEPGFSTAQQVSELSGRGIGLDVVRSQLRAIKGTVKVTSSPGAGTTFTLCLPLTLTITKLIVVSVGTVSFALPTASIEEVLSPQPNQVEQSESQRRLYWQDELIPIYPLADLLEYTCPLPESFIRQEFEAIDYPKDWAAPLLVLRQDQQCFALEVNQLVTEQELVIKSFGSAIAPPAYVYGCTVLRDGTLVPVIDGLALLEMKLTQHQGAALSSTGNTLTVTAPATARPLLTETQPLEVPTILVVDDAVALRRTLALSLEHAGFQVLQARDGQEAISQLQQRPSINLVVCDIEMPNMNGFEFLSYRRQDAQLAQIPVVMLTSRSNDKHRWLAMQLGASAYFTKPYLEQEFIETLQTLLSQMYG